MILEINLSILVAGEIWWRLASALPFGRRWTETCIVETLGFRPDAGVQHCDDDITLCLRSVDIWREAHEVPWSRCVQLLFGTRKHRHHSFQAWIININQIKKFYFRKIFKEKSISFSYLKFSAFLPQSTLQQSHWSFSCSCGAKIPLPFCWNNQMLQKLLGTTINHLILINFYTIFINYSFFF